MVKTARILTAMTIIMCGAWPFEYVEASPRSEMAPPSACVAQIQVPSDKDVYSHLARIEYGKVHMTCPINVETQHVATVFILDEGGICHHDELFGYRVVQSRTISTITAKNMYNKCSGVIITRDQKLAHARTRTYTWSGSTATSLPDGAIYSRLAGALISSGLPISKFVSVNDVFCFEVDSKYTEDPMTSIRRIGVPLPTSLKQTRYENRSCDDIFGNK